MTSEPGAPGTVFPVGAIEPGAPLFDGLREVAIGIDRRARSILRSDLAFEPESVHALRLAAKRLRAYWQLVKPLVQPDAVRLASGRLREAAAILADSRDEHVLRGLLLDMATSTEIIPPKEVKRAAALIPAGRVLRDKDRRRFLETVEADADIWTMLSAVGDRELLDTGLGRAFARTRELGVEALRDHDPEALHGWRRWVKYLRYQLEPLVRPPRDFIAAGHAELDALGTVLGTRNDLHNLCRALRGGELPGLDTAIRGRDALLAASLAPLPDTVLGLETAEFLSRVSADLGL
jgi:CHAD domain-containing protein